MHLRHHVDAVDDEAGVAWQPQRGVQHRAILGDVDVLARQHGVSPLRHADLLGEVDQGIQDLAGHQVLRQVDVQVTGGEGE